jgi:hypothetical protein
MAFSRAWCICARKLRLAEVVAVVVGVVAATGVGSAIEFMAGYL